MKSRLLSIIILLIVFLGVNSCEKQEYLRSASTIKKDLLGQWELIPIPLYVDYPLNTIVRIESWVFSENSLTINTNYNIAGSYTSNYSIHASATKAEIDLDGVNSTLIISEYYNGKWQIVSLKDGILAIANDYGGNGLRQLEFIKR